MPRNTKLKTKDRNPGTRGSRARQSAPRGTFNSRTMIVIRIAMTPSLNASRRPLLILCLSFERRQKCPHHPIATASSRRSVIMGLVEYADPLTGLIDELKNFESIAGHLLPQPGEIPRLHGIDI